MTDIYLSQILVEMNLVNLMTQNLEKSDKKAIADTRITRTIKPLYMHNNHKVFKYKHLHYSNEIPFRFIKFNTKQSSLW